MQQGFFDMTSFLKCYHIALQHFYPEYPSTSMKSRDFTQPELTSHSICMNRPGAILLLPQGPATVHSD
jgi:hypothetical protein